MNQATTKPMIDFSNPYETFNDDHQNIDILQEECGELITIASKNIRFGPDNYHPKDPDKVTNRDRLVQEIGDVLALVDCIRNSPLFDISHEELKEAKQRKLIKLVDFYDFGE